MEPTVTLSFEHSPEGAYGTWFTYLAHENGCVEELYGGQVSHPFKNTSREARKGYTAPLDHAIQCAIRELDNYDLGGVLTHNACVTCTEGSN